ncbi:MAG: hypothetical protein ACI9DK_003171 [Vicingaceae bacterium]|jgi:hypothetical protein
MKRTLFLSALILTSYVLHAQVKKVLFLGNSYTTANNLPQLLKDIGSSYGDSIFTDQNTPGGSQLNQHSTNTTTLAKIRQDNWDYVVIQEQSQKPSFSPAQVANAVFPFAQLLCDSIKANWSCSEPVFYMTWGRENGDASNCASYPPVCTYWGMQQRLRDSYMTMSTANSATTSPVGVAWKTMRDSFPTVGLYAADGSHPNLYGSYLAACVFYSTFTQKTTVGCSFIPSGISTTDALNIQKIASKTVLDSLNLWRVNANFPLANFTYNGGPTTQFTNTSTLGQTYFWDFGDGGSSVQQNPTHTYFSTANYQVKLITYSQDSCFSDTISKSVNVISTQLNTINSEKIFIIYPNPTEGLVQIKTDLLFTNIAIADVSGKEIIRLGNEKKLNLSEISSGTYFLSVLQEKETIARIKLIKR